MNPSLSIDQLKRLKGIMQTMLLEANNANWQELSRLDSERRVLIDYKERASGKPNVSHKASSGGQPPSDSQTGSGRVTPENLWATQPSRSPVAPESRSAGTTPTREYLALSAELTELDKEITTTVLNARHALLEQTRGLRAQVSAKKRYEQANTMKVSSYS